MHSICHDPATVQYCCLIFLVFNFITLRAYCLHFYPNNEKVVIFIYSCLLSHAVFPPFMFAKQSPRVQPGINKAEKEGRDGRGGAVCSSRLG